MGKIQIQNAWREVSPALLQSDRVLALSGCSLIAESKSGSNSTHFFTVLVEEVWIAVEEDGNPCIEIGDQIPERLKLILIPSAFPNGSLEQLLLSLLFSASQTSGSHHGNTLLEVRTRGFQ